MFGLLFWSSMIHARDGYIAGAVAVVEQRQAIDGGIDYVEDERGTYTLKDILDGKAGSFIRLDKKNFGFRYDKVLWIRFRLDFRNFTSSDWFLTQEYEHVGELSFFYPTVSGYQRMNLHEQNPFRLRPFQIHN